MQLMKCLFASIVLVLGVAGTVSAQTASDCNWSTDGCPGTPPAWTLDSLTMVTGVGGCDTLFDTVMTDKGPIALDWCCRLTAHYKYRLFCGRKQIMIDSLIRKGRHCPNPPGGSYNPSSDLRMMMEAVLTIQAPAGWAPFPGTTTRCDTTVEARVGMCWHRTGDYDPIFNKEVYKPCTGTSCCGAQYAICTDPTGTVSTHFVQNLSAIPSTCDSTTSPSNPFPCVSSCPWGTDNVIRQRDPGPSGQGLLREPMVAPDVRNRRGLHHH
jgi:hypothetical protein